MSLAKQREVDAETARVSVEIYNPLALLDANLLSIIRAQFI